LNSVADAWWGIQMALSLFISTVEEHYPQIALIFYFFSREFALFAVDFSSTMRNPKEPLYFPDAKCLNRPTPVKRANGLHNQPPDCGEELSLKN